MTCLFKTKLTASSRMGKITDSMKFGFCFMILTSEPANKVAGYLSVVTGVCTS